MLRLAEEILLLILDNEEGDTSPNLHPHSLNIVLAGATLVDLALENRIDTDVEQLMIVDSAPVRDALLDPVLADIAKETHIRSIAYWLERIAVQGDEIRHKALSNLVGRGILESDEPGLFFFSDQVSRSRRYPAMDGMVTEEVQLRIMRLLFSNDIPDPRDVAIVILAASCDLFRCLLSREELASVRERIDLISRMDSIGRTVAHALRQMTPPSPPPAVRLAAQIPQVSGWPLVGSVFDVAGDLSSFLVRQYRELGPIFQFRALNRRLYALAGPEANRFVQKHGRIHLRSYETWRNFNMALGAKDALVGMDGPGHVRMRKVHTKAFSGAFIEGRMNEVVAITRRMIVEWPHNQSITAQYAMQRIITEQLAILVTGVSARDHVDELIDSLDGLLRVHVMRQTPSWILRLLRRRRARKRLDELYTMVLARHSQADRTDLDLIVDLLKLHKRDPQFFPETDLQLPVLGPFFAGIETAASTSAFMLYALLKHPELLVRMTAEADSFFGQETLSVRTLRELDVTQRILLETLRMYPAVPGLVRTVANYFKFAERTVPAGTKIIIGNTVAHHLPEHFPDPQRFDIERYKPERAERKQPEVFAPFGLGTHRCLGSSFAEVQIALTLLTIVREVELVLAPTDYELKVKQIPAPHPAPSLKFRILGRRRNG